MDCKDECVMIYVSEENTWVGVAGVESNVGEGMTEYFVPMASCLFKAIE